MSHFSSGQLNQVGNKLEVAGWSPEDLTNLGQASVECLTKIRLLLHRRSNIFVAIEAGETELWLHPDQKTGWARGHKIHFYLTDMGMLDGCADLDELKIVQAQGVDFFRKYFVGKIVVGWRGVSGNSVPYLIEDDGRVVFRWLPLDGSFGSDDPGLRRK